MFTSACLCERLYTRTTQTCTEESAFTRQGHIGSVVAMLGDVDLIVLGDIYRAAATVPNGPFAPRVGGAEVYLMNP